MAKSSRQPSLPSPVPPSLKPSAAKAALQSVVGRGHQLLQKNPLESAPFETWCNVAKETLVKAFGSNSNHISTFNSAGRRGLFTIRYGEPEPDYEQLRREELTAKVAVLDAILEGVDFGSDEEGPENIVEPPRPTSNSREVFVVHGHDEATKARVALLLERLGLNAVILHERANEGLTIIEKFEKHAGQASFAIVLLTPDDVGCAEKEGKTRPRARQNVILELGYFIGRLGRARACACFMLRASSCRLTFSALCTRHLMQTGSLLWRKNCAPAASLLT